MTDVLRVLELFAGIGGCAAALGDRAEIVAAVDQHREALAVHAANFAVPVVPRSVQSMGPAQWTAWRADLWWMSPPCPPFTRRGLRRDLDDPRTAGFVAVVERIAELRPRYVALENVPGFSGSRAHAYLRSALEAGGYTVSETLLCPTELGVPNRRLRFYLVAGRDGLAPWPGRLGPVKPLRELLDTTPAPDLWCGAALARRYPHALHVVRADDPHACASCFTAAYGRSPVRSGSYLATAAGLRRFSPREILRLLDFPPAFRLPATMPHAAAWPLVGNSVSVRAVRWALAAVPDLAWLRDTATGRHSVRRRSGSEP